ncbi:MAG: hypothetical protein JSW08_01725 [archaeon]|nr:MAG: hypothetical protein JSW08_01725 [archaeon]
MGILDGVRKVGNKIKDGLGDVLTTELSPQGIAALTLAGGMTAGSIGCAPGNLEHYTFIDEDEIMDRVSVFNDPGFIASIPQAEMSFSLGHGTDCKGNPTFGISRNFFWTSQWIYRLSSADLDDNGYPDILFSTCRDRNCNSPSCNYVIYNDGRNENGELTFRGPEGISYAVPK